MSHSHRPEGENALLMRGQKRPVHVNRVAISKCLEQQQCEKRLLRINITLGSEDGLRVTVVNHARYHSRKPTARLGLSGLVIATSLKGGITGCRGLL